MSKVFAAIYAAAVLALVITAVLIFQLRCESFGCMGIGVAWFAWGVAYFPVLALGGALVARRTLSAGILRITRALMWVQIALGAALLVAWVSKNVAWVQP